MHVKMTVDETSHSCNAQQNGDIEPNKENVSSTKINEVQHGATSTTSDKNKNDQENVVGVLTKSIDILSKLANLDHAIYRSTLAATGTKSSNGSNDVGIDDDCNVADQDNNDLFLSLEKDQDPDKDAFDLQQRLEIIQREWKLEDTSIPQLAQAIHRLQSNTNNLVIESDRQTMEIQSLQNQLQHRNQRVTQLEQAVHKLHKQNKKLKEKLIAKRLEKKSIVKNVKEYVSQVNSTRRKENDLTLEEERVAQQLKAHEQLLRMEREFHIANTNNEEEGGNRSRFNTFDSVDTFTDLDLMLSADAPISTTTLTDSSSRNIEQEECDGLGENIMEDDIRSRTSSTGSLLEQGVATIRYSPTLSPLNSPKVGNDSTESQTVLDSVARSEKTEDDKPWASMKAKFTGGGGRKEIFKKATSEKTAPVYKVSFPPGSKVGLQFHRIPFDLVEKKQGVITGAMLESPSAETEQDIEPKESNRKSSGMKKKPITFQLDGFRRRKTDTDNATKTTTTQEKKEAESHAFLVCGYLGFDTEHNVQPTLGAHLVGIDHLSLYDEQWTASRLKEVISACSSSGSTFSLSFRNDPLSKKQNDTILKAAKLAEESSLGEDDIVIEMTAEKDTKNDAEIGVDQAGQDGQISRKDPLRRILNIQTGPPQSKVPPSLDVTKSGGLEEPVTHESQNEQQEEAVAVTPPSAKFKKSMNNFWKQTKEQLKGNPLYD